MRLDSAARKVARETASSSSSVNGEGAPVRTASIAVFTASACPLSWFKVLCLRPPGRRVSRKFSQAAVFPSADASKRSFGSSVLALAS